MYESLNHIVCLGASAGGLEALEAFFEELPTDTGAAFVVVVHLSPDFKSLMPEILGRRTPMPVAAVTGEVAVEADHVYVISPGHNLDLEQGVLTPTTRHRGPRSPVNLVVDHFLGSLAEEVGDKAVAIILSGTGSDGSRGVREVKDHGGTVLVQEPATAKFDGMPTSTIQTGLCDHIGPPADLAERVVRLCRPRVPHERLDPESRETVLQRILGLIKVSHGSDHSAYRRAMVLRRIQRRMAINGIGELVAYQQLLESDATELHALRQDLLIGVTGFFRDPAAFSALQHGVLPRLLADADPKHGLRVWVAGCSTGQEAYSVSMAVLEAMEITGIALPVKVFATDLNETAVRRASRGVYTLSEVADVPVPLVGRYFEHRDEDFVVRAALRETTIFARHDVITDPPFTRMDLVVCRNLLIYLQPDAQRQVLTSLHFALRPETGVLFLGNAEIPHGIEDITEEIDGAARLYRRDGPSRLSRLRATTLDPVRRFAAPRPADSETALRNALDAILQHDARTAALITNGGRLVQLLADPNGFFQLPKGAPSTNLRQLLPAEVVTAFAAAASQLDTAGRESVYTVRGIGDAEVRLRLTPIEEGPHALLLLELTGHSSQETTPPLPIEEEAADRILRLEEEVNSTRESLQASIEELQSTNEEQQSTNEELVAANEELQSTNEELHSVNQELFTVNAELQRKNQDLQVMTSDLDNLITSIDVGTLYLDADLCVRRFTPGLERVVKLMDQDLGRHITDFAHHLTHDFVSDIEEVVASGCPVSREVRDQQGAWLLMRARPYKTFHHAQAGVLLTFIDITRLKHAEETARVMSESLRDANEALSSQAEQLEDMFSIVAHDLKRPVLGLDGLMAMAADALEEDAVDLARTHLGRAQQSLDTLKRLLADLSSVSQQARAELQVESVELGVWFDALLAPFAELAARRGITLNRACDGGQVAFARAAGEAAIVNLVENALQYGMGAEQPRLDVSCRYNTSTLTLVVSDNGKGIARADHARAFELFRRLSPDDAEGSGVGLVSVRRLVQRAGGTLDLESDTWQGARFEVTLPVEAVDKGLLRFLLVEDDALDAKATRIALPHHEVDHVFTLTDAEDALTASRYDCVLLDLSLPDGHGLALLGTMKRLGRRLPVALLTGLEDTLEPDLLKNQREIVATFSKSRLRQKDFREMLLHALETAEPG